MSRLNHAATRRTLQLYGRFLDSYRATRPSEMVQWTTPQHYTIVSTWQAYELIRVPREKQLRVIHAAKPSLTLAMIRPHHGRILRYTIAAPYLVQDRTDQFRIALAAKPHRFITREGAFRDCARFFQRFIGYQRRAQHRRAITTRSKRTREKLLSTNTDRLLRR